MGSITRESEDMAIKAMKVFLNNDVIMVYREPDNKYRDIVHDDYTNCTFARGRLLLPKPRLVVLQNPSSMTRIDLDDLLDLIPTDNLKDIKDADLKLFTFYSTDTNKPSDEYNILSTDPVRAFASRNDMKTNPLYLSHIQKPYAGLQFNTMRNE
jgi:hypothetical protein